MRVWVVRSKTMAINGDCRRPCSAVRDRRSVPPSGLPSKSLFVNKQTATRSVALLRFVYISRRCARAWNAATSNRNADRGRWKHRARAVSFSGPAFHHKAWCNAHCVMHFDYGVSEKGSCLIVLSRTAVHFRSSSWSSLQSGRQPRNFALWFVSNRRNGVKSAVDLLVLGNLNRMVCNTLKFHSLIFNKLFEKCCFCTKPMGQSVRSFLTVTLTRD